MKIKYLIGLVLSSVVFFSCMDQKKSENTANKANTFNYNVEQFADIKVLRYQIPGWENLTLKEQKLVYYLTKAGLSGRDIIWDQNYRHNLTIRKALENIYFNFNFMTKYLIKITMFGGKRRKTTGLDFVQMLL